MLVRQFFIFHKYQFHFPSLEEHEVFCDCKEQLVFELHQTFAIGGNLEASNCVRQVTCQIVVAERNGVVFHRAIYLELC